MTPQASRTRRGHALTLIVDLFREGFSTEEIVRLCELRSRYPLSEHLSRSERTRLAFFKWRLEHGAPE